MTILLVHIGEQPIPASLFVLLDILLSQIKIRIIVITESEYIQSLQQFLDQSYPANVPKNIELVSISTIPRSSVTEHFYANSKLDRSFRKGFWVNTSARFFIIADYLEAANLDKCLHLENDVIPFFDAHLLENKLVEFAAFAIPLDRTRAIPGSVWFARPYVARALSKYMTARLNENDMVSLGNFVIDCPDLAKPLPTIPTKYALQYNLDTSRYCRGEKIFGGVFDAAAIGQYLGGIHWLNDPSDTKFFINESSELNMTHFNFSWVIKNFSRYPVIRYCDEQTPILTLHVHSKNLSALSPKNTASHVLGLNNKLYVDDSHHSALLQNSHSTQMSYFSNILNLNVIKVSLRKKWIYFGKRDAKPNTEEVVSALNKVKNIFLEPSLIEHFQNKIAPHLSSDFNLITTAAPKIYNLKLLNNSKLGRYITNSNSIAHSKISYAPLHVSHILNNHKLFEYLGSNNSALQKTKLVAATGSFSDYECGTYLRQESNETLDHIYLTHPLECTDIEKIAAHKFLLCLDPSGVDCEAFWVAQCVDTIPIILEKEWSPVFSELPILLLSQISDLSTVDLVRQYIQITSNSFKRPSLRKHYLTSTVN
jgi:hypothetical protein